MDNWMRVWSNFIARNTNRFGMVCVLQKTYRAMITKEQLDVIRKSFGDMGHGKGELIVELCDEIEALTTRTKNPSYLSQFLRELAGENTGATKSLIAAADEIDRLTLLLQGADMQLKERESAIEVLKGSLDFLKRYHQEDGKPHPRPVSLLPDNEVRRCIAALKEISGMSIHSEPVGVALAMQEIACNTILGLSVDFTRNWPDEPVKKQ